MTDSGRATPLAPHVRSPGGKRALAERIVARLLEGPRDSFDTYAEPFLGGGAVFWALVAKGFFDGRRSALLSDGDAALIAGYQRILDTPDAFAAEVDAYARLIASGATPEERLALYGALRDQFNVSRDPAAYVVLRQTGFSGLVRLNRQGDWNVAPDPARLVQPVVPDQAQLRRMADALRSARAFVGAWDWRHYLDMPVGAGWCVYLDPPYDSVNGRGHTTYTGRPFTRDDLAALIEAASGWAAKGATVVLSNADTPFVREQLARLWPAARVEGLLATRKLNRNAHRPKAAELLISQVSPAAETVAAAAAATQAQTSLFNR